MSATPEPSPQETRLPFSRGVNLGNTLEAPLEGAWGLVIQDEWMPVIHEAGFDHIRLPVRWSAHADGEAPYTIDATFLARVDHVLDRALEADPERLICITGANWSSAGSLSVLDLPERVAADARVFATFHFYEPFPFTHQNAEWVKGADAWTGTKWNGTTLQQNAITRAFDQVVSWQERNGNMPVLMGEFGAYSAADEESRARWTSFVTREAERRGFAWSYWEFASGFGIYGKSSKQYDPVLLKALIPETP